MKSKAVSVPNVSTLTRTFSLLVATILVAAPLMAQRPAQPATKPAQREAAPRIPDPTFDTLLSADAYKIYGEVRNVGQLLSTGGAADIIDPVMKFAGPPEAFQLIVKFLKSNSEALATSRLLVASWPARRDVPNVFLAIEFATPEEAAKFSPKLESFLPSVLPPTQSEPEKPTQSSPANPNEAGKQTNTTAQATGAPKPGSSPAPDRLPFVISHARNLVFISDRSFKFEKLHPPSAKLLTEDANFRIARDRFSAESIFLFFNVELEDRTRPQPSPTPVVTTAQAERRRQEDTNASPDDPPTGGSIISSVERPSPPPVEIVTSPQATPEPTPTPTTEQKAQAIASAQIGQMFDLLGIGEPQWPEAVGLALVLDNNEYVVRAILIEPQDRQKLPLPFVPQLISGPGYAADAPSVLPNDTEIFVSASIDLARTYEGMRREAEIKARAAARQMQTSAKDAPLDTFSEFERKAGFKIKDDLLPALGNEIAVAGSLKTLEGAGFIGAPAARPSPEKGDAKSDQEKKAADVYPMLLVAIKDRDTARRLLPRVLDGLGVGEANLIAQKEKREDAEIVSYAGAFAYAFVGNFLVISEAATVRRVVDAALNHETLSANNAFKNFTRWQSHQALGQIYVSPALMEQYREQLNKQAPKLDPALRDLVMRLNPVPQAISYSLSNEGFGALHELHLPKDLVVAMVAGMSAAMSAVKEGSPETNEMIAIGGMSMIASAENSYRTGAGKGSYGNVDQLTKEKLFMPDIFSKYGYKIDVTVSGDKFEAVATPLEYGKTGSRSFFVDKSGVVRGDDHGGAPATSADKPVQ
jgi:Protein of unknown function (DUF3352)